MDHAETWRQKYLAAVGTHGNDVEAQRDALQAKLDPLVNAVQKALGFFRLRILTRFLKPPSRQPWGE